MKRSQIVILTMAGVSLGLTGCRRQSALGSIIPPEQLPPALRATLPTGYVPGSDISAGRPPHNAYDARLGYYHEPCNAWFPYPYNHHDPRWGYYRCGRWSSRTRTYTRPIGLYPGIPGGGSVASAPQPSEDFGPQPANAPIHSGIAHADATKAASGTTHRGGFGGTGRSVGFRSPS